MTKYEKEREDFDNGAFYVIKTRWDTYQAKLPNGDGICSGLVKEAVVMWAREHVNGYPNSYTSTPKGDSGYQL